VRLLKAVASGVLILAVGSVWGWGSLVATYASPASQPRGLGFIEWLNTKYIIVCTNTPDYGWRVLASDGSVAGSFPLRSTATYGAAAGRLTVFGYIWVAQRSPAEVDVFRAGSWNYYDSYGPRCNSPYGLAFHDTGFYLCYLYVTDDAQKRLYQLDAFTGYLYNYHPLSFTPGGLAYDENLNNLWVADRDGKCIRQVTTRGKNVASFPFRGAQPGGVAFDGTYVWVGDVGANRLHVYEVERVGVGPASLGRVKALFR
jgi:hypothetical protein